MNATADLATPKADFDRDGFTALPAFYRPDEVADVLGAVDRYLRDVLPGVPAGDQFYETKGRPETLKYLGNMQKYDAYFQDMLHGDRFVKVAEALLDGPVNPQHISLVDKPPRAGKETPPHQDGFYGWLEPNEALTLWIALDPVDADNGCMRYVAGSHRQGYRAHERCETLGFSLAIPDFGPADREREAIVTASPGDVLVHHSGTIHRADPNRSDRTRRALVLLYYSWRTRENTQRVEEYRKKLLEGLALAGKI